MEGGEYRERAACKRGSGAEGATGAEGGANREIAAWRAARGRDRRGGRRIPGESCAEGGEEGCRARAPPP